MNKRLFVGLSVAAIALAACSSGGGGSAAPSGGGSGAPERGAVAGRATSTARRSPSVAPSSTSEATNFAAAVKPFEDATGAKVVYNGDKSFEQQLNVQVQAGNPPDVALLPQPGGMKNYASQGKLFPLPADIVANIDSNYGPGWKEIGTAADGKVYGVFHRVNLKGNVFYPKAAFDAKGYTVPEDVGRAQDPQDKMVADGTPAWCIGIESGAATGWPATDWVEQIMLRTVGKDGYDKWVNHEIPFTDPTVKTAFQT